MEGTNKIRGPKMGIGCHIILQCYNVNGDAAAGPVRGTSSGSRNSTRVCLQ